MNLSEHFTLAEATRSDTAVRRGIDNTPSDAVVAVMKEAAMQMERVRALLAAPIKVTSWYRCEEVNRIIGGVSRPGIDHASGWCVDFVADDYGTPREIALAILRDGQIKFDQLIYEGGWVHISFAPPMRGMVLTAHFEGGTVRYTQGVA